MCKFIDRDADGFISADDIFAAQAGAYLPLTFCLSVLTRLVLTSPGSHFAAQPAIRALCIPHIPGGRVVSRATAEPGNPCLHLIVIAIVIACSD
jgi:hypothetical protein